MCIHIPIFVLLAHSLVRCRFKPFTVSVRVNSSSIDDLTIKTTQINAIIRSSLREIATTRMRYGVKSRLNAGICISLKNVAPTPSNSILIIVMEIRVGYNSTLVLKC